MSPVKKPILITSHPRCGTGYMAALCRAMGVQVGHETMLEDGISSWLFAVEGTQPWVEALNRKDYEFDYLIHVLRHPIDAVNSIAYIENTNRDSLQYRLQNLELPEKSIAIDLGVRGY